MNLEDIWDEYEQNGRLTRSSTSLIRALILNSDDPYRVISLAADCGLFAVAPAIATTLSSTDPMVRWIALATLLSRFALPEYARIGLEMARSDPSQMVHAMALTGLGEILADLADYDLRHEIASLLVQTLEDEMECPLNREAAYDGIAAAMDVPPIKRLSLTKGVDTQMIANFKEWYILSSGE